MMDERLAEAEMEYLNAATMEANRASAALESFKGYLARKYRLGERDLVNVETGGIIREKSDERTGEGD